MVAIKEFLDYREDILGSNTNFTRLCIAHFFNFWFHVFQVQSKRYAALVEMSEWHLSTSTVL